MTDKSVVSQKEADLVTGPDGNIKIKSLDDLPAGQQQEILGVSVDDSGSMSTPYNFQGKTIPRRQAAQLASEALYNATDWNLCDLKFWTFSDDTQPVFCDAATPPVLVDNSGGTNFDIALQTPIDAGCTRIVLCSDGEASYPDFQVKHCIDHQIPVDCVFIGGHGGAGEILLQRIADETGGTFCTATDAESLIHQFEQLETSNRLLLEHHEIGILDSEDEAIKL